MIFQRIYPVKCFLLDFTLFYYPNPLWMVSHKRKNPAPPICSTSTTSALPPSSLSSLAHRQILPQTALCRQRYNAAFQALQNAYRSKQHSLQRQKMSSDNSIAGVTEMDNKPVEQMINEEQLIQLKRNLANYRERWRTEELNEAFKQLRRTIPSMPSDKMSKIHTLRVATEYIQFLDQMYRSLDSWTTVLFSAAASTVPFDERQQQPPQPQSALLQLNGAKQFEIGQLRASFNSWRSELAAVNLSQQKQLKQQNDEIDNRN